MPSIEDVRSAWDEAGAVWASSIHRDLFRAELHDPPFFDRFLPDLGGKRVIDLGCGEGRTSRILAARGARVTGVDLAPRLIEAARAREAAEPQGIDYLEGSFADLSGLGNASFEAAVSTMAFMDGPDFPAAARAAARVLVKGGSLYFSVYHPCFWTQGARFIQDRGQRHVARLVGRYWDGPFQETWRHNASDTVMTLPRFPHRLEEYVNGLCEAGLRITRMMEPRASAEMAAVRPKFFGGFREVAPILLFVAATAD